MTASPVVSVVIPARNAAATIAEQLAAVASQDFEGEWEVVVADNRSTDATLAVVAAWADRLPSLQIVHAARTVGSSHARNVAMAAARGELVAFCDADDVVARGWLRELVAAADGAGAVGGRLDYDRLNDDEARAMRPERPMNELPVGAEFLPRAIGANFALRKEVWSALGRFDESYRHGATETELLWRMQLAGHSLAFAPDAVVHYRLRTGRRSMFAQFARFGRAQAHLYRDFRDAGMPRTSVRSFLASVAWLVVHATDLRKDAARQGRWIRTAATRWGRLVGSARHGVVYL